MDDKLEKIEIRKLVPFMSINKEEEKKMLNILLNYDILKYEFKIEEKYIYIIRYNPKVIKPCCYHLKLEKIDEQYCFYKELETNKEKEEINPDKKRNSENDINAKYGDIFYMIELNEIIFIKDKDYLENHDIVVISSDLCNYENNINNIKIEEKKNSDGKILKENNKKSFNEIIDIIKNYVESGILILNNENNEKNIYFVNTIINFFQNVINNFIIILNIEDNFCDNEKNIQLFKELFSEKFPKNDLFIKRFIYFALNENQFENELLMKKSFNY
jgi:hypothetical protein